MNERVKLLAEQAGFHSYITTHKDDVAMFEKFAELIVRQCIGMVLPYNDEDPCAERLYKLADTIAEHFGVEE